MPDKKLPKGGVSSYNTDKGNGMWMRNGKLGADSWHMGQIGKAISSGALSTRGISNAKDFKMPGIGNDHDLLSSEKLHFPSREKTCRCTGEHYRKNCPKLL